jgi:hypothetical protein
MPWAIPDQFISKNEIEIMNSSYEEAIKKAKDGDVIYIDPPYDYEDDDGFTKYQMSGFTFDDFKRLKEECDKALNKGAFVIISNNATKKVVELFEQDSNYEIFYDISKFTTLRSINCVGSKRKTGKEAIFWGMNNNIPFPLANDMNKLIKLLMAEEDVLSDKNKAKEILGVKTIRQVTYYLSALLFFKYSTHDKKFTELAQTIKGNEDAIIKDIYYQLLGNKLFKDAYDKFYYEVQVDISTIKKDVAKTKRYISESTINRRASTIKSWVEWMYSINADYS